MDQDGPPPRKKISRFFSDGQSLVGSLPGNKRRTNGEHESLTPLIETPAYTTASRINTPSAVNAASTEDDAMSLDSQYTAPLKNLLSRAAPALHNPAVRDKRRNGIIGIESLRRPGSELPNAANHPVQADRDFVIAEPTNPLQSQPFQAGPIADHNSAPEKPAPKYNNENLVRQQAAQGNYHSVSNVLARNAQVEKRKAEGLNGDGLPVITTSLPPSERRPSIGNSRATTSKGLPRRQWPLPAPPPPQDGLMSIAIQQQQAQRPQGREDTGPLNALPPQLKTSNRPLSDAGFRQPFLPRPANSGVDTDRDISGKKLPPALRPIHNLPNCVTSLPQHATLTPARRQDIRVPATYYTSPARVRNAFLTSQMLKRKRAGMVPPPPAFTWQRTNDPAFSVFAGILLYPELVYALAAVLPVRDLVSLYAISCDFHTIVDTRFTTVVLSQSLRKAPESSRAFPFRCYAHLCRQDPTARIPHPNPAAAAKGRIRLVPSFRWLKFVLHREKVVHELVALFAEDGVPLPRRCSLAIKRMWFILDIPDNARRIGYIHNVNLFTDLDLYFAMCFFVKLDMRLNDPVGPEKRDGIRKLLLAQESLTTVLKVLRRDLWAKQFDVMREWIRYKYTPLPDEVDLDIFDIPAQEVGKLRMEYWGRTPDRTLKRPPQLLLRPDQLVMREAIKRGLRFHKHFLRCLTYGYVRMDTLENFAPRAIGRRKEALLDEYEIDDDIGGLTWSMEKAGLEDGTQGEMLDLGMRKDVSLLCIEGGNRSMLSKEDRMKMEEQEGFLQACVLWAEDEMEEGDVDAKMLMD